MILQEAGGGWGGHDIHRAMALGQHSEQWCREHHVAEEGGLDY
jgi:hypothetical protein